MQILLTLQASYSVMPLTVDRIGHDRNTSHTSYADGTFMSG